MPEKIYTRSDFNFDLPADLIAQNPAERRDASRLFVLRGEGGRYEHRTFSDLPEYLRNGDILVFNDARVLHARLHAVRETGGLIELVLTQRLGELRWLVIASRSKRLRAGERLRLVRDERLSVLIVARHDTLFEIETGVPFDDDLLERIGDIPLPPYITRDPTPLDSERYQTVYARSGGAVAAPTAGLHFTAEMLGRLGTLGVSTVFITLDVSWGTFQPVRDEDLGKHLMHSERFLLGEEAAAIINAGRREKRRIIAVGTTSLRVLEATFVDGANRPGRGETDIFIYPPQRVRSIDALITNFHTPYSTLLMLIAAFAGYDRIMDAYREAVRLGYRFFSYGDSMFIV